MSDTKLDKMLAKIQALIAKADSTDFPEEAATFRAKAEALMHQYRIEESMLASAAPAGTGLMPIWQEWNVCPMNNEFREQYMKITSYILHHVGGEGVFRYKRNDDRLWAVMECVGFESDLRYGQMLLTSALLAFGGRLEPKYDPNSSDQVNAYNMRKAGMEGRRIAVALWGHFKKGMGTRAVRLYAKEATLRGENPEELTGKGNNVETYRRSYAEGFADELWWRLYRMKYTKGEEGQYLVLAGRAGAVMEAFYERYPQFRPDTTTKPIGNGRDGCAKCAKAKSGYCRDHAHLKRSAQRERPVNAHAAKRGAEAAATVDLGAKGRLGS